VSARDVGVLICRGIAILVLAMFVIALPSTVSALASLWRSAGHDASSVVLSTLGTEILEASVGLVIWFAAPAIAARMAKGGGEARDDAASRASAERLVVSSIGLWLVAQNTPEALAQIVNAIARDSSGGFLRSDSLLRSSISVVIGAWLFFGAAGIAGMSRRVRTLGLEKK
jgi:hypothetical protein